MKNFVKLFGIIALAVVFAFSFAACGDEEDNNNNNGSGDGYGSGTNSGWPPANILSEFGVSGLTPPPGTSNITHTRINGAPNGIGRSLSFFFTTTANINYYDDWFTSNGWTSMSGTGSQKMWQKSFPPYLHFATYSINISGNQSLLSVGIGA